MWFILIYLDLCQTLSKKRSISNVFCRDCKNFFCYECSDDIHKIEKHDTIILKQNSIELIENSEDIDLNIFENDQ